MTSRAVDVAGEAEREVRRACARRRCPTARRAESVDADRPARRRWRARWRSARRSSRGIEQRRGRRARASKPMSVRVLEMRPFGGEARAAGSRCAGSRCGCRPRRAPPARRASVSPASSAVEPRRRRARGRWCRRRRSGRSRPRAGVTLPSACRSIAPPSGAVGEPGEDREVGDADRVAPGVDQVGDLAGAEDRQAVAADLELADAGPAPSGGSAASAKRSMRVPSARATSGSAARRRWRGPRR